MLDGKIVLVTGATRGIGKAIALTLGKAGATVIGTATSETGAKNVFEMLEDEKISGKGIVLDVKDNDQVSNLEESIKKDFGSSFIITLAPVQYSIENDVSGMGGFVYKDLYNKCGYLIEYFNVQCYYDYSLDAYKQMIKNGYPEEKIVMGSISSQNFNSNLDTAVIISTILGLFIFGFIFAINSSLHSYLILAFSSKDKVAMDVGFYYSSNALGRLVGTLLSGILYQTGGVSLCLFCTSIFLIFSCFSIKKLKK